MTIYTACFSAVAVSAAQDVFEIAAAAGNALEIYDIKIGQYSDFGDAAAEILGVTVVRGYTTTGTGGTTVTANDLKGVSGGVANVATVKANNTGLATGGTGVVIIADACNIAAGWSLRDALGEKFCLLVDGGQRVVVRITAPADALTMNGTLVFGTAGSYPVKTGEKGQK